MRWLPVLALTAITACSESNTIDLGASLQVTGNLAGTGRYYRDGYQLAVDKINESGGVRIGEKHYKLALRILDNESDPKLNQRQHEDLVTGREVDFLLGPFSSNAVLAGSEIAEKHQVPMVQGGGASSRIFVRGSRYVFGLLPAAEDYFGSTIAMLQQLRPEARTVGLVTGDDAFDVTVSNGTTALLEKAGLQVVLHQHYSERTPNFFNILTLIKARSPDMLLWSGHEAGAIEFVRAAKSRNIHPNLLQSFTVGVPGANFRASLGKDANYVFGMTPWLPSERLEDRWFGNAVVFARAYQEKFGYPPDYHAAAAAAAVETFALAIEAAGTSDRDRVREAIGKLDFQSIYGRVHFGESGQIEMPQTVIQIQDGQVVEIFRDAFINRPVYPVPAWDNRP
jgi:branched-chain amino acid transport system substrate-binding protein